MRDSSCDEVTFEAGPIPAPKLTALYQMAVRGIEAGHPESLKSYVNRLALAHRVSLTHLCRYVLRPLLLTLFNWRLPELLGGGNEHVLSGSGVATSRFVHALEIATGQTELIRLTLVPLGETFSQIGLTSQKRRHCPECLTTSLEENYGQLLWEIGCVKACPLHGVRLADAVCGGAALQSKSLRTNFEGVCSNCGSIGYRCGPPAEAATVTEVWEANQLAELLAAIARDNLRLEPLLFRNGLRAAAELAGNGVLMRGATNAGIPKSAISEWLNGHHRPSLQQVIRLCLAAKVSLVSVALGIPHQVPAPDMAPAQSHRRKSKRPTQALRKAALCLALEQQPPPSLQTIGDQIGIDRKMLSLEFPELSGDVVAARKELTARVNLAHRKVAASLIRFAVADLARNNRTYTLRNIREACGDAMLPNDMLRRAYEEVVSEIRCAA